MLTRWTLSDQTSYVKNPQIISFKCEALLEVEEENLDQTFVITFQSINISNTKNIKKFWVGIFKGQSHISQV